MLSSFRDSFWAGRRSSYVNTPVITAGLVMYVDAGNIDSYPDFSSNTWFDISGKGNHLTLQNKQDMSWRRGYFRTGSTGFFDRTIGIDLPLGDDPYTIGVWARQPFYWGNAAGLLSIGDFDVPNQATMLRTDQSNPGRFLHSWWTNDLIGSANGLRLNRFFSVIAQYDGTTRKLWINGQLAASDIRSSGTHNVVVPKIQVSAVDPYAITQDGDMSIAFIYDRALTAAEVAKIYATYRPRFGI